MQYVYKIYILTSFDPFIDILDVIIIQFWWLGSVAGSVIQATGKPEFEDGFTLGNDIC